MDDAYITQDDSEVNVIFIHSKLDEVGLTSNQFRIYAHLSRRAHSAGKAWPGIDSMAEVCKMHKETVIESLRELEERAMITVERSPGKRSIYRLPAPSKWRPVGNGERSEMGNAPVGNGERYQSEMGNVRKSKQVNPKKTIHAATAADALEVYSAYPLKVARPDALKSITKAIEKHGKEKVLSATVAYARAISGKDIKPPHPTTWYNQERYNDESETWTAYEQKNPTHGHIRTATACDQNAGTCNETAVGQYR